MTPMVETLLGPKAGEGGPQATGRAKGNGQAFARALGQALGKPGRALGEQVAEAAEGTQGQRPALRLRLAARLEASPGGEAEVEAAAGKAPRVEQGAGAHGERPEGAEAPGETASGEGGAGEAASGDGKAGEAPAPPRAGEAQVALAGAAGARPGTRPAPGKDKGSSEAAPTAAAIRAAAPSAAEKAAEKAAVARTVMPMPIPHAEGAAGEKRTAAARGRPHQDEEKAATSRAAEPGAPPAAAAVPTPPLPRLADALGLPAAESRGGPGAVAAELPAAAAAAAAPALRDGAVEGALLRSAAHLRLETPTLGELELHLRIRENTAHLRVEGEGARLVEARAGELQRALAGEGLKLGSLELPNPSGNPERSSSGPADQQRPDRGSGRDWDEPPPPPTPGPAPRRAAPRSPGGVHVKA